MNFTRLSWPFSLVVLSTSFLGCPQIHQDPPQFSDSQSRPRGPTQNSRSRNNPGTPGSIPPNSLGGPQNSLGQQRDPTQGSQSGGGPMGNLDQLNNSGDASNLAPSNPPPEVPPPQASNRDTGRDPPPPPPTYNDNPAPPPYHSDTENSFSGGTEAQPGQ